MLCRTWHRLIAEQSNSNKERVKARHQPAVAMGPITQYQYNYLVHLLNGAQIRNSSLGQHPRPPVSHNTHFPSAPPWRALQMPLPLHLIKCLCRNSTRRYPALSNFLLLPPLFRSMKTAGRFIILRRLRPSLRVLHPHRPPRGSSVQRPLESRGRCVLQW